MSEHDEVRVTPEQSPEPAGDPRESRGPEPEGRRGTSSLASTIAAAAATITAVVAVVIAVWDNVQTRQHNRLSVLPYVVLQREQRDSAGVNRGALTFSNEGVGPAILQGLEIRLPAESGRDTVVTTWGAAAPLIQRQGVQILGWMDVIAGSALGVQRNGMLLRVEAEGDSANPRMQAFLDRIRLRLRYASIYGEEKTATLGEW